MLELPPLEAGVRTLSNNDSTRLRKLYPGLPKSPNECVTCSGSGEFQWWADNDRTEVGNWKCSCPDQWVLHRFFLNSGVGLSYQRLAWVDALGAEEGAVTKVLDYLDRADAFVRAGCGLILHGNKGTGKSLLASLVLRQLLVRGYDGYFTTFSSMLSTLMDGYSDSDERVWFHRRIKNAQVLVIDDLGREHRQHRAVKGEGLIKSTTAVAESAIDEVLRHRTAASLPTILTTNLDLARMEQDYGDNIISLLRERSTTYEFIGEDYRAQARMRLEREVDLGLTRPVVVG